MKEILRDLVWPSPKVIHNDFGERKGEREGEKHRTHSTRDQTFNLGMCPDQESNPRPFSVWDYAPTDWATPVRNSFLKKKKFYLFIFRKMGREGEKHWCVRDTSTGCLSHTPNQGPGLQPRHVHWLGIEPATLWFSGWCSIHWVTPARAEWVLYAMTGAHDVVWIFTSTSVILNWYSEHKGKHVLLVASC